MNKNLKKKENNRFNIFLINKVIFYLTKITNFNHSWLVITLVSKYTSMSISHDMRKNMKLKIKMTTLKFLKFIFFFSKK